MRQAEAEAISPPLLAPGVVPLQVCRAEEIHSRWLPLRDERERKQEPGKGPASPGNTAISPGLTPPTP